MTQKNKVASQLPHTAISSCSGYIYQGKIAVMHCLKLFEELGEAAKKLKLQIESIDDFAILNPDNSCKSMHQVKAKKNSAFTSYRVAIEDQLTASNQHIGAEVYFHTAVAITNIPTDFTTRYSPVQLYTYTNLDGNNVNNCTLNQVDKFNEAQAKKAYKRIGEGAYKSSDNEYLEKTRQHLEDIVVRHILTVHNKVIENRKAGLLDRHFAMDTIPLTRFYEILKKDIVSLDGKKEYFHYLLLNDAGYYFHEFCQENILDPDTLLKLNYYLAKINSLNIDDLTNFIRSILPHKKAAFTNIRQYKDDTFSNEDFKFGLLNVLNELTQSKLDSNNELPSLFYWLNENEFYYPTAINVGRRNEKNICSEIISSSIDNDVDFLFESGKLINQEIDSKSIFSSVVVGASAELEEEYEDRLGDKRVNSFKKISLISLDKAKEIINE